MGSTIGRAIDYLVAGILGPAQAINPNVEVADFQPTTSTEAYIVIGRESPDAIEVGPASVQYASLGQLRVEESYTLPGFVYVEGQGPGSKAVRDLALSYLDVVIKFVHDHNDFGGLLEQGRIAQLQQMNLSQAGDPGATGGQVTASITFTIAVQNTYIP